MPAHPTSAKICVVIGASHAGVNLAFALRRAGWEGDILLFDADPELPYHRPPLSKTYLTSEDGSKRDLLMPAESYARERIGLYLGRTVDAIDRHEKHITLRDGGRQAYDKLVIATGARPLIPPIPGIDTAENLFPMRTAVDALRIRQAFRSGNKKRVVVIGGGYIGLETAASLRKLGAEVTVLEREERIMSRVTSPELAEFLHQLHVEKGVRMLANKEVVAITTVHNRNELACADGTRYPADLIVLGCGIRVNKELAEAAGLEIEDGIRVDPAARTSDEAIYAVGDCTYHYNPHYDRFIRLESVQNAVDQAKIAAAAICGQNPVYNAIPWFWSDQYNIKLQIAGLSADYDHALVRKEVDEDLRFSVWYFKGDTLLAVDAVNHAKAYVLGTKFIRGSQKIDKAKLADPTVEFRPGNFITGTEY